LKTLRLLFAAYLLSGWLFITPAYAEGEPAPEPAVTVIVTNGGDDVSYQIPLTTTVIFDEVTYSNVYATTNSVITFGNPDGTYWTYPNTPSVSIESRDWWALPTQMPDTHFIIKVSDGGFQVDGAYRPFGTMTGEVTSIVITAQITLNGEVEYTYAVEGPLYGGERTGARLNDGSIVTLEAIGITEVTAPVELAPEPVEPTPVEPEPVTPVEPVVVPPVVPVEPPVITPEIVIPYIPPQIIVIDTNLEPLPTTEELTPEPPTEELLTDGESVPVDESSIEETLEQVTQELEQESQLEGPIDTPIDNQGEPTSETVESQEPITQAEMNNLVEDLVSSGEVTSQDAVEILEALSQDGEITQDEVNNLSEALSEDGTFTESERELVAEALIESAEGEAVTVEAIAEAGITLEDLPPSTPVEVRQDVNGNEVIVIAEVAAALVVLESPVELLTTIFSDPAQALLAIGSIGADMSDEERAESEQTIVAAVIVSGIAVQSAASAAIAGSASYRRRM
jgi:hypothetical protein